MLTKILAIPSQPPSSIQAVVSPLSITRIPLIDILRGYALFGIFLVRMVEVYSGWTTGKASTLPTAHTDMLLHQLVAFFAIGKFRALFSLLFGLSFYLQLQKFEQKGLSFTQNFLKRLGVLFLFGLVHTYLLWSGDILRWYAFAGLILIPLYKLPTRALFFAGAVLVVTPNIAEDLYHQLSVDTTSAKPDEALAVYTLTSTHSYWEMLKANFIIVNAEWMNFVANLCHVLVITGYFLLGVWVGRLQLFIPGQWKKQYLNHKQEIFKLAIVLFSAAIIAGIITVGALVYAGVSIKSLFAQDGLFRVILFHSKTPFIVLSHIVGIYILLQIPFLQKQLSVLAYAGRMTLTNYIMQSMFGILIFYGIGLGFWGTVGPTYCIPLTLGLFLLQVWGSKLYLSYFKSGPLEYIWRILLR
ncbi:DUF418 domain-containing protein [Xanthocytophaga agilis]|uniref:DUF418 domain-containing protein n=1 Tax=Xanthocytophaga agilis TaxID=3048010 RepID=A0AAE3UFH2_9BACT|nr:DUF418 domain-containing protein [Xanthocytophaga agilis]MDJ1500568.1 DUF418 domain-containing protein [Xanthocytophaga agilis]